MALNRGFCEAKRKRMGFAVYHGEKGKGSGGGIGAHIDRTKGMERTYPHADPERINLNQNLIPSIKYSSMSIPDAIRDRIEKGYQGKRKVRNDSVKFIKHVLTGSHEDMKRIFSNKSKREAWVLKNYKFIVSEYGQKNILRFTLHLDEKTPHIHAVTVPLTKDGRLSAKEVFGNKGDLVSRQDRYAEAMKEFGLDRGLKGTGIKHDTAKEYYSRIKYAQDNVENTIQEPAKNVLGVYKEDSVIEMQNALKASNLALLDLQRKYKNEQIKASSKSKSAERAFSSLQAKDDRIFKLEEFNKKTIEIIRDPERSKIVREQLLLQEKEARNKGKGRGY